MAGNAGYHAPGIKLGVSSPVEQFAAYDTLPRYLRDTIKNLHADFDAVIVAQAANKKISNAFIANRIIETDRKNTQIIQRAAFGELLPA